MNLLLLSVDSLPHVGGISLMSHHLANAWAARGEVVVVGPSGAHVPDEFPRKYRFLEDRESSVRDRSGERGLVEDARICELVTRIVDRYRVSRVLLLHPFYYAIGTLDACEGRVPVSVYIHGFELRSQLVDGYPRDHARLVAERRLATLRERLFYTVGRADEILVNSRYTASLLDGFEKKSAVRVTGCGIPDADLARELALRPSEKRAARRRSSGGPHLGYVGRLVPTKGIERVLRLVRAIPGATATLVGTGPFEDALRDSVRRWKLERRVTFLGRASESAKWEALRDMDFLCLLSEPNDATGHVEGFGIALLEGAAAGAVPVSSGAGGMKDVVAHGRTGLILPKRDEDAATMIARAWRDEHTMAEMVGAARKQLETKFNWAAVAATIERGWE